MTDPQMQVSEQPPKKRPTVLIVAVVGVLVVLAAVAAVVLALKPSGPDPKDPKSAVPACREQVKERLKSPATAQFPGGETIENDGLQDKIVGVYDAQNGFGALTRGNFRCLLRHDDAGRVEIASVTVDG